jgi:hypothetical protein
MWYWLEDEVLRSKRVKLNTEHFELHEYAGDFYEVCWYIALVAKKLRKIENLK